MAITEDHEIDPRHPAELRRLADLEWSEGRALLEAARRLADLADKSSWIESTAKGFARNGESHLEHARRLEETIALKGGWPEGS